MCRFTLGKGGVESSIHSGGTSTWLGMSQGGRPQKKSPEPPRCGLVTSRHSSSQSTTGSVAFKRQLAAPWQEASTLTAAELPVEANFSFYSGAGSHSASLLPPRRALLVYPDHDVRGEEYSLASFSVARHSKPARLVPGRTVAIFQCARASQQTGCRHLRFRAPTARSPLTKGFRTARPERGRSASRTEPPGPTPKPRRPGSQRRAISAARTTLAWSLRPSRERRECPRARPGRERPR